MNEAACKNTDRELWREKADDYYSPSIHVTERGGIGIDVGGHVVVQSLRDWHACARPPKPSVRSEDFVQMPIEERARKLVGDMPWVTEHLEEAEIFDFIAQIEASMRCAVVQTELGFGCVQRAL